MLVSNGRVARVAKEISPGSAGRSGGVTVIDAAGLWLWPGLVDLHVHLREPGFPQKETIRTGGLAAAAGGYTTVVCEPNTEPPIDSVQLVRELVRRSRAESAVNVYFKAAMTKGRCGKEPADISALAREPGVVALSDDGDPVVNPSVMAAVCRAAAAAGIVLTPHCEDSPRALAEMAAGLSPGFKPAEPYANEPNYLARDVRLAAEGGARVHFSHISMARSVEIIEQARARPDRRPTITFETAPHYLLLCTDDYAEGVRPTVNPPLRRRADRDALARAVVSGVADALASDHAPHTAEDKARGASGLIGLETTLGLVLTHLVGKELLTPTNAVRLMSLRPAQILGLPGGTLRPGSPADMALIDPGLAWTVEPETFRSRCRNTPFAGWHLRGRAVATFVRGTEVWADPSFEAGKSGTAGLESP